MSNDTNAILEELIEEEIINTEDRLAKLKAAKTELNGGIIQQSTWIRMEVDPALTPTVPVPVAKAPVQAVSKVHQKKHGYVDEYALVRSWYRKARKAVRLQEMMDRLQDAGYQFNRKNFGSAFSQQVTNGNFREIKRVPKKKGLYRLK